MPNPYEKQAREIEKRAKFCRGCIGNGVRSILIAALHSAAEEARREERERCVEVAGAAWSASTEVGNTGSDAFDDVLAALRQSGGEKCEHCKMLGGSMTPHYCSDIGQFRDGNGFSTPTDEVKCDGSGTYIIERQRSLGNGRYGEVITDIFNCPGCKACSRKEGKG